MPKPLQVLASPEAIAESLAPFFEGDSNQTRYLSFRASGFTVREAAELVGVHERTIRRWREDSQPFHDFESNITAARQALGAKFALAEFLRNFRLVMERDWHVLRKVVVQDRLLSQGIVPASKDLMTEDDNRYLRAIRPFYTPAALQAVKDLADGKESSPNQQFNFTAFIMSMARERGEKDEGG